MRSILAILFLSCLTCFGQFGVDQPFFLSSAGASFKPTDIPGLVYWWVSSDVIGQIPETRQTLVTNWPDRMFASPWTNLTTTTKRPSVTKTAVHFNWNNQQYFEMALGAGITTTGTIWAIVARYRDTGYQPLLHSTYGGNTMIFGVANAAANQWFFQEHANVVTYTNTPAFEFTDIMLSWGSADSYFYTNGALAKTGGAAGFAQIWTNLGGIGGLNCFGGSVIQIAMWPTNKLSDSDALSLHQYSTNLHPVRSAFGTDAEWATNTVVSATLRNNVAARLGFGFYAWRSITVSAIARWKVAGNSQDHTLTLRDGAGTLIATVPWKASNYANGAYGYTNLASSTNLPGLAIYYVESTELNAGDQWYDGDSMVICDPNDGWIIGPSGNSVPLLAVPDVSYGPVNFMYK